MQELIARNPKQLNICLRYLYAENIEFIVSVKESDKGKIYYSIAINIEDEIFEQVRNTYRILIS